MNGSPVVRVSIVIPAYNAARYLRAALQSVLAQTYRDYEVIVVDDGSTDDTKAVVIAVDGPVQYLRQANQGPSVARNTGIAAASGEFICFLDADDLWTPDKLGAQVEFMERHPQIGLVFADEDEFDEHGSHCASLLSKSRFHPEIASGVAIDRAFQKLLQENFVPTSTVMVRRSCLDTAGLFDVALRGPEDRDMWSRIAAHFPIAGMPCALGRKRAVPSSVSRNVESTLRSRVLLWRKAHHLFPDLAPVRTVNALLTPTYVELGFVLLDKNETRQARDAALEALKIAREPSQWLLATALLLFGFTGRAFAKSAFGVKRRMTRAASRMRLRGTALAVFAALSTFSACGGATPMAPTSGPPRTVYVATTGNDRNNGAISAPWQTLRFAVAQLRAGDTLYVRGGTYTGTENTIDSQLNTVPNGTSWSDAVTIAGYAGETVTIQPPAGHHGIRLSTTPPSQYLIFQDLTIDLILSMGTGENGPEGVYLDEGSHHNRFQRLEVMNAPSFGFQFSSNSGAAPFNEVLDCRVHDIGIPGGSALNGHALYIKTDDNLIAGNTIYNNQGYGLSVYHNAGPQTPNRTVIRDNRIYNNGLHGGTAYGITVAWGDRNLVLNNLIYGNPGGILVYTNSTNAEVRQNTVYSNTPLEGISVQYATGTAVKDNIVYGNETDIIDQGSGTILSGNQNHP